MKSRIHPNVFVAALSLLLLGQTTLRAQAVKLVKVVAKRVGRTTELPGEFFPFLDVQLHAKVPGYVEKVFADRGSFVKQGDLLVQLTAPEMMAHISQAQAQVTSAESDQAQAQAQLAATQSTYSRIQDAAKTPGAVAENDIIQARQQSEAAEALVQSRQRTVESMKSNLKSQQEEAAYLRVTAPFDGVISTRYIHPGALVGPGSDLPLLELEQVSHLRLAIAVPESDVAGLKKGVKVDFKVPAYPDRVFSGVIARPAYAVDMKTRTMPVELDVPNGKRQLAPGMYPSVLWPIEESRDSILVPPTSIVTTTERVFVIRNNHGRAQWVKVRKGSTIGNLVEVDGNLKAADEVVDHATDELRDGSALQVAAP